MEGTMTFRSILFITTDKMLERRVKESRYMQKHCSHRFYENYENAIARLKETSAPAVHFVVLAADHIPDHFLDEFAAIRPRPKLVILGPRTEHIGNSEVIFVTDLNELERVLKEQHAPEGRTHA
jgi:hypothetical protein